MKKILDNTTNSRVYKMTRIPVTSHCGWCAPHKGCNRRSKDHDRTWKNYRGTQWRE